MYLKKAKEQAHKDEVQRAREHRHKEAKEAHQTRQQARSSGQSEAKEALRRADEKARRLRVSAGQSEAQDALRRSEERKRREQAELAEAMRRSKIDEQREADRRRQAAAARRAKPPPPRGGLQVVRSAPIQMEKRVPSFHEPDELDRHWKDASIPSTYVGTFAVGTEKIDKAAVIRGMRTMEQYIAAARPAALVFSREGIKVIDTGANKVAMAHALARISMATTDEAGTLFGFVAKNPKVQDRFCHVFNLAHRRHAEDCQAIVTKAFRLAFTSTTLKRRKKPSAVPRGGGGGARPPQPVPSEAPAPAPSQRRQWAKHNPLQGVTSDPAPKRTSHAPPPTRTPTTPSAPIPSPFQQAAQTKAALPPVSAPGPESIDLSDVVWYQPGIPREIAIELLEASPEGSFIVRDSSSQPGQFALTMKERGLMHHFIIRKVPEGLCLGSDDQGQKPLSDLATLVVDYSRTKGCLPCCLNLDSFNTLGGPNDSDSDDDDTFVDPDYQAMKDFRP